MATVWDTRRIGQPALGRGAARLGSAAVVLLGVFFMGMGTSWDINWHATVGRDSFWIAPHLVLYAGTVLALAGVALGLAVEWAARRRPPLGAWVTAAGAVWFLASAPFDDLWHRLYGLDVTIWSPPHLSLIAAAWTMVFGALLVVLGERRNDERPDHVRTVGRYRVGLVLTITALTFLLQPLALATLPAARYSYAQPGLLGIWLLPLMLAVALPPVLFMAPPILRWPGAVAVPALVQVALRPVAAAFAAAGYAIAFPNGVPVGGTILGLTGESVAFAQSLIPVLIVAPALLAALALIAGTSRVGPRAWALAAVVFGVSVAVEGAFAPTLYGLPAAPAQATVVAALALALAATPGAWLGHAIGSRVGR